MTYIIATRDARGQLWFLSRGHSIGQFHRTAEPFDARTWGHESEVHNWLNSLPGWALHQIQGKELLLIPVTANVGEPIATLPIPEPPPEPESETKSKPKGKRK